MQITIAAASTVMAEAEIVKGQYRKQQVAFFCIYTPTK